MTGEGEEGGSPYSHSNFLSCDIGLVTHTLDKMVLATFGTLSSMFLTSVFSY